MPPLLVVDNARVYAGNHLVLQHADMAVDGPGVYLILGPNGAGKTCFLSALAGRRGYRLEGTALYMGKPLSGLQLRDRALHGLVLAYQTPPPLRGVRVSSLIAEVEKLYGPSPLAETARERLGINTLMNRMVSDLSGGERKRLELLLALMQKPRLLLLDEPDSGVDIDTLTDIADIVEKAVMSHVAVLLVSHTLGFVKMLAERNLIRSIHLADQGVLARLGLTPREALEKLAARGLQGLREAGSQ